MSRKSSNKEHEAAVNELRSNIHELLGRKPDSLTDCRELSEKIYRSTGHLISYNTLRRFFNLVDTGLHQPNSGTLQILRTYVETENAKKIKPQYAQSWFADFLEHPEEIEKFIENAIAVEKDEAFEFLQMALIWSLSDVDKKLLRTLFSIDSIFSELPTSKLYPFMQTYALLLNSLKQSDRLSIINEVVPYSSARNYYFEWFPDIDHASEMTLERIPLFMKHASKLNKTFSDLFSWYTYLMGLTTHIKGLTPLEKIEFENSWHPVLKGRYYACCLGYYSKSNAILKFEQTFERLIELGKTQDSQSRHMLLVYPLQMLYALGEYRFADELIDQLIVDLPVNDHITDQYKNHVMIYEAGNFIRKGHWQKAKQFIQLIDPLKFPRFEFNLQTKLYSNLFKSNEKN